MENKEKKKSRLVFVIIVLLLLVVFVVAEWSIFSPGFDKTKDSSEEKTVNRQLKSDEDEEEKEEKTEEEKDKEDLADRIEGKYNKAYLQEIIETDKVMSERQFDMCGYECMDYWYTSRNNDDDDVCYDEFSYYVFEDEKTAKKAFKKCKESWIDRETDSGDNYVQGWEGGVCDAEVEIFIYQTDNMIITTELLVISAWAVGPEDEAAYAPVNHYYRKDFIMSHF